MTGDIFPPLSVQSLLHLCLVNPGAARSSTSNAIFLYTVAFISECLSVCCVCVMLLSYGTSTTHRVRLNDSLLKGEKDTARRSRRRKRKRMKEERRDERIPQARTRSPLVNKLVVRCGGPAMLAFQNPTTSIIIYLSLVRSNVFEEPRENKRRGNCCQELHTLPSFANTKGVIRCESDDTARSIATVRLSGTWKNSVPLTQRRWLTVRRPLELLLKPQPTSTTIITLNILSINRNL